MACRTCGQAAPKSTPALASEATPLTTGVVVENSGKIVEKSTTDELVKLRYYGGGSAIKKTGKGCRSCGGGKGSYTTVTTETIMFVSEDAPNSLFKLTVQVGHDYYVTRSQADYMLTLTYRAKSGLEMHKFKEV